MERPLKTVLIALAAIAWPLALCAATPPPSAPTLERVGMSCAPARSDLGLDADVHMDSLRFDVVPKRNALKVTGRNELGGYTVRRTNLPTHPKPGVTYKNVRLQIHLASTLVDPNSPSTRC